MKRAEAAALATQKASENARKRRLEAAAALLREAGWTVIEPSDGAPA